MILVLTASIHSPHPVLLPREKERSRNHPSPSGEGGALARRVRGLLPEPAAFADGGVAELGADGIDGVGDLDPLAAVRVRQIGLIRLIAG